jgi:putative flippase GtrA
MLEHPIARHPLVRKITGYSAGSVVALVVSQAAFAATLGWAHRGTTISSAVGFVGGAIPNYILNRRWAWRDRRGRDRRSELTLYMAVSFATFIVSAGVTHIVKEWAVRVTHDRGGVVVLTTLSFLLVSALFFVVKFFIYETFVFRKHAEDRKPSLAPSEALGKPLVTKDTAVNGNGVRHVASRQDHSHRP